jgi:hypothetical protein
MLFLDLIGIDDCATWVATEIVSGVTCTATILAKAGEIDAGTDLAQVVRSLAKRRDTRIVMGSIREPDDVTEALTQPAGIVAVPPSILEDWLASPASPGMAAQFAADAA